MGDKPFFVYFAPGATHAPHHVPPEWSAKYKGRFDQGWDVLREETLARQKELGVVPPETELTARPDEIPAWDDMPDDLKPVLVAADGGLRRLPGAHRPPCRPAPRRARRPRHPRRHARLLHHRRQRRERRGRRPRLLQRAHQPQRRERPRRRPSSWSRASTTSARLLPTTTTRSAGRTRWTRRTSGRSRSPRTGAVPATARSSTGREGSRSKGEVRASVPPRDRRRPDGARGGRPPGADTGARRHAAPDGGREHALRVRRRRRGRPPRDAVLRDVLQPRHLPRGLDRGDASLDPVGRRACCRRSRRTSGSSTTPPPTGARRTTSRPRCPRSSRS